MYWIRLCPLAVFLVACAISPDAEEVRWEEQTQQAASILAESDDPDSLAAAVVLLGPDHVNETLPLIARATSIAPRRADLAWLHAQACSAAEDCDPELIEARLRTIDPSNGAAWMGALSRADSSHDEATLNQSLAAIGASERVDTYWTSLNQRLSVATSASGKMSLPSAVVAIIGGVSALGIPSYSALSNACKGDRLNDEQIIASCRAASSALMRGDTYITEMVGVAIAKRAWPAESVEAKAAAEARRVYRYRSALSGDIDQWSGWDDHAAEEYLRVLAESHREQDALVARIVRAGKDPNPPADWSDESEK